MKHGQYDSKFQASIAELFDKLDFDFSYNEDEFDLDGVIFTPNFYLPTIDTFITVRAKRTDDIINKVKLLQKHSNKKSHLIYGNIKSFKVFNPTTNTYIIV